MTPPPVLHSCRLIAYAIVGPDLERNTRKAFFAGGERVDRIPCLAIGRGLRDGGFSLVLCDETWGLIGFIGASSIDDAKDTAEKFYAGLGARWAASPYADDEVEHFIDQEFGPMRCSFCGSLPWSFDASFSGRNAIICDRCIRLFQETLDEKASDDS